MKVIKNIGEDTSLFSDIQSGQTFYIDDPDVILMKTSVIRMASGAEINCVSLAGGSAYHTPVDRMVHLVEGAFVVGAK